MTPSEPESIDASLKVSHTFVEHVLEPLKRSFVGKDEIVDLIGVSLIGGENLFLLGPSGTAKSALIKELAARLHGHTFEYLLTRFTEPNELFGPFDIRRLREGDLVTNTEGMLPEASLVFLDELLNANSAILNSLLGVLNEKVFRRGRETRPIPMLMCVGASNRLPEDEAINALFDRFLLRVRCENVGDEHLREVLSAGWSLDSRNRARGSTTETAVTFEDVRKLNSLIPSIDLSEARPHIASLVIRLRKAGFAVSDRRAVRLQRLIAASAILAGRRQAILSDLWVFRYIWDTVEQQEILAATVQQLLEEVPATDGDHPRARGGDAPDPEVLARDLDALLQMKTDPATADRLGILAARCQWVRDEKQRVVLLQRVDSLWRVLNPAPIS